MKDFEDSTIWQFALALAGPPPAPDPVQVRKELERKIKYLEHVIERDRNSRFRTPSDIASMERYAEELRTRLARMIPKGTPVNAQSVDNLTPHPATLYAEDTPDVVDDPQQGLLATYAVSGPMARCGEERSELASMALATPNGPVVVEVDEVGFGDVVDLPEAREGTIVLVSRATAERVTHRRDVFYPDRMVRDTQGRILGFRALARAADLDILGTVH